MALIDKTALPVALPAIQRHLGASAVDDQRVVAAYAACLAVALHGGLADRYGPRLPLVAEGHPTRHRRRRGFVLFVVSWSWGSHWTTFFPATAVLELGLSILAPAVTTVALKSVDVRRTGWLRRSTKTW
jgi:MFS family permease